jgi:hypothetical protein
MIEGSGSGSIPLTNASGSRRPKNIWIRWIRIRIRNTEHYDPNPGVNATQVNLNTTTNMLSEIFNYSGEDFLISTSYGQLSDLFKDDLGTAQ